MSAKQRKLIPVWMVMIAVVIATGGTIALAQKSGGGVTGGDRLRPGTWGSERASRSIQHARDNSHDVYRYSRDADHVDPVVAKAQSEELGHSIEKAQKDTKATRQELGNDPAALAALKSVEKHLAAAVEHHKMLHEECCKDSVDGGVCMKHCNMILAELDKAQVEQDALIREIETKAKTAGGAAPSRHQQH